MIIENIDGLKYNHLRRVAKQYGINAKQKAADLRAALKQLLQPQDQSSSVDTEVTQSQLTRCAQTRSSTEGDELPLKSTSTPQTTEAIEKYSGADVSENGEKHMGTSSGSVSSEHITQWSDSRRSSKSGSDAQLNTTYELESSKVAQTPVELKRRSNQISNPATNPSDVQPCPGSHSSNTNSATAHPPSQTKSSHVRPVPNFHRIHARAASKMESLPQFMQRRQAIRPPFASPPYHPASGTKQMPKSKPNRALTDLSNRTSQPVAAKQSSGQGTVRVKLDSSVHNSAQSRVAENQKLSIHKYTPKIPADSAFARRKAYDLKRNLARLSSHTPNRQSSQAPTAKLSGVPAAHGTTALHTPALSTPALARLTGKASATTTVPRIDPREQRPGLSVAVQRERNVSVTHAARAQARRAMADARRGLL